MIDLEAKISLRDVENGLRRMQLAGVNLRPVFARSRRAFVNDQKQHVKDRVGKDAPWPILAPSTIAHRATLTHGHRGRKLKKPKKANPPMLGRLPMAFKLTFDARRMTAKSRVSWSRVHWKGGRAGRGSKIPQREFMWISDKLLKIVARNAVDYMLTKWKR